MDNLGGGVLLFFAPDAIFAALVGVGSLLLALGLRRTTRLPSDGLLTIGICGPAGMAMLAAPWPLGLGPIVPAVVTLYAVGWVRLVHLPGTRINNMTANRGRFGIRGRDVAPADHAFSTSITGTSPSQHLLQIAYME
jgi:hypothetical protein